MPRRRTIFIVLFFCLSSTVACRAEWDGQVTGTVAYRERVALSPGAVVTVELRDVSMQDSTSDLIARQIIGKPGQVPVAFELRYDREDIKPGHRYALEAQIHEGGRLRFRNAKAYPIDPSHPVPPQEIWLVLVRQSPQ